MICRTLLFLFYHFRKKEIQSNRNPDIYGVEILLEFIECKKEQLIKEK